MALSKSIAQDFKLIDNDLYIDPLTGDFVIWPSDNQHEQDILNSSPGWYKEFPWMGAQMFRLLKAKFNPQTVECVCKQMLEADGFQVGRPSITINTNGTAVVKMNAIRVNI